MKHKMFKTIHLNTEVGMAYDILFSLWSPVKENAQTEKITRHREERGLNQTTITWK